MDWHAVAQRAQERYADGEARLSDSGDDRQRQLTRMGNAANAVGLCELMSGGDGREWLMRAADRWRESWAEAPPGSWGRPIGAIKARILAGDWEGGADDARWALEAGAQEAESPIGRYAATLALLVLEDYPGARVQADELRTHEGFPSDVADGLAYIAAEDVLGFIEAVESVLESFESREEYLEDIPVADTVLVLLALGGRRGLVAELESPLLP